VPRTPDRVLRRLEWTVLRRLDGLLQGDYRTLFRGQGLDLADIREYVPGDDVRHIDWNVTARMDIPYVREYHEDRDLSAHFLVDLSPSMDFGSVEGAKKLDLVTDVTAALARVLTRRGNRVGAILYGRGVERVIPARSGRIQVLRLIDEISKPAKGDRAGFTKLSDLLEAAARTITRRSLIFVVTDLITAPGWEKPLGHLASRHEVLMVRVNDPSENALPDIGGVYITDAETGEQLWIDTGDIRLRTRFAEVARRREEALLAALRRARVDVLSLSTDSDLAAQVLRFAAMRKLQRARRARAVV
jgi:uncharacterized protein (DUF58 family)